MPELIHLKGQEVIAPALTTTESTFSETFSSVIYTVPAGKRALVKPRHAATAEEIIGFKIYSWFQKNNVNGTVGMTATWKLGDAEGKTASSYAQGATVSVLSKSAYFQAINNTTYQRTIYQGFPTGDEVFVDQPPILLEGETVEVSMTFYSTDHVAGTAYRDPIEVHYDLIIIEEDNV